MNYPRKIMRSSAIRGALTMAMSLVILLPLGVATGAAATAVTAPALAGQIHPGLSDNWYIRNYNDYLTDPYGGGNGAAVKFDYKVENSTSTWILNIQGEVTTNPAWPFADSRLDSTYSGDTVSSIENLDTISDYSLGAVNDAAVMRPDQDGNYFVFTQSNESQVISVYASNVNDLPECLTDEGAGNQARYTQCNQPGQTMDFVNSPY
jgi:hypothetical protein